MARAAVLPVLLFLARGTRSFRNILTIRPFVGRRLEALSYRYPPSFFADLMDASLMRGAT
jgi:hypothetical protein